MSSSDERLLLEQAKRFESEALAQIFDNYNDGIYRYALRIMGDSDMARECMSETFSRLLKALHHGAGPVDYLQAYLYRIAHNWITDYFNSNTPPSLPLDPELYSDPTDDPPQAVADELAIQKVRSAIALLTPDQRQVISLKYLEEWKNEEIARALKKPIGAVKSIQHRAIGSLRRILSRELEIDEDVS